MAARGKHVTSPLRTASQFLLLYLAANGALTAYLEAVSLIVLGGVSAVFAIAAMFLSSERDAGRRLRAATAGTLLVSSLICLGASLYQALADTEAWTHSREWGSVLSWVGTGGVGVSATVGVVCAIFLVVNVMRRERVAPYAPVETPNLSKMQPAA